MAQIQRLYDFQAGTTARSAQLDEELNQLVNAHNTLDTDLVNHKTSGDHDERYYTKTQLDGGQLDNRYYTKTQLDSGQLDNRYYTESEVTTMVNNLQSQITTNTNDIANRYTKSEVDSKDANLQSQINNHKTAAVLDHPDGSVTTNKIANQAVTREKIAPRAIGPEQIDTSLTQTVELNAHKNASVLDHPAFSVTTEKLATEAVTFDKLGLDVIGYIDGKEQSAKAYTDQKVSEHSADYVKHPADGGTTGGTATAYTCSSNPAPTALVDKIGIVITAHVDSGANPTLNWNGLGAKPIKKPNGNAAVLKAGGIYTLRYSAASGNFIVQGEGASGNATASDLLSGKTASTDAGDIVGTMPNMGAYNITPGTSNITIPAGYHNGSGVVYGDPDLIPANIKQGIDIFGIVGTLEPGKRFRSGTVTTSSSVKSFVTEINGTANDYYAQVTGLPFQPTLVVLYQPNGGDINITTYKNDANLWSNGSVKIVRVWGNNLRFYRDYDGSFQPLITSNGFTLPFGVASTTIQWIAFE